MAKTAASTPQTSRPVKPSSPIKKVVLAYSGGLDTSIILKWLQETYGCEVVTFTADLGQGEELEPARKKAELMGIKPANIFIDDLREVFVRDYVFPMFRANAVYEGVYLLGTSIARPLIAKRQIEIARQTGADAVCHGATGKGNDQVRFELTYYALEPSIKIIAPWREWAFKGREDLLEFARANQIPIAKDKEGEAPFSVDANLLHSSSEGKVLEDPAQKAPELVYQRTISPMAAPDKVTTVRIGFAKGDAVSIDGHALSPATLLAKLNDLGKANGIGRLDLVENRFVGMKSRGVYETPGGTILLTAHRAIESITLDRGAAHLKDDLMPRYAELIYYGFWESPERHMLQALIDKSQDHVEGEVTMELYKGNVIVVGRESSKSLYSSHARHLRGRSRRLRPEGRGWLHPAERPAAADAGAEGSAKLTDLCLVGPLRGAQHRQTKQTQAGLRVMARARSKSPQQPITRQIHMGQIEIFRIGRIPIHLDFMFIVLAALWSRPYWQGGDAQMYSAGFVLVIGLFVSILLHELGHAWTAKIWGVETRMIELNGIGGLCHFERSLPRNVLARTVVGLAGPFANLLLWQAFGFAAEAAGRGLPLMVMSTLASANFLLLVFNLLPSFPLDGGRVLDAWLTPVLGGAWSTRVVAGLGFAVAAWLVSMAIPSGDLWMVLLAAFLALYNWRALQTVGGFGWR